MTLQEALNTGRKIRNLTYTGATFLSRDELYVMSISVRGLMDAGWESEPAAVSVTRETLINTWNMALPQGTAEENKAPLSARWQRFESLLFSGDSNEAGE